MRLLSRDARLPVSRRPGAAGCAGRENSQQECAGISSDTMSVEETHPEPSFLSLQLQGLRLLVIPGPGGPGSGKAETDNSPWTGHMDVLVCVSIKKKSLILYRGLRAKPSMFIFIISFNSCHNLISQMEELRPLGHPKAQHTCTWIISPDPHDSLIR